MKTSWFYEDERRVIKHLLFFVFFLLSYLYLFPFARAVIKKEVVVSETDSLEKGFFYFVRDEIKENDFVYFRNPNKALSMHHTEYLIKRVKRIENGKAFVIGRSEDDLYRQYGIKGLKSFDSETFGAIPVKDLRKVKRFAITNTLIKFTDRIYCKTRRKT